MFLNLQPYLYYKIDKIIYYYSKRLGKIRSEIGKKKIINVDHGRYSEHEDVFKTNSLAGVPIRQFRHDNVKGYERFVTVGNEVYAHSEHVIFYTLMHYNNNMNCYFNSIHII